MSPFRGSVPFTDRWPNFRLDIADGVANLTFDRPDKLNALTFDGYRAYGSTSRLARLANSALERWRAARALPDALTELRACLFFEQRRWHHFGESFDDETMRYVRALIERMRELLRDA